MERLLSARSLFMAALLLVWSTGVVILGSNNDNNKNNGAAEGNSTILSLNQKLVLTSLGHAKSSLLHLLPAHFIPHPAPSCLHGLNTSLLLLADAEHHVSTQNWYAAKENVASAILHNSECASRLVPDEDPLASTFSYLTTKVEIHLKAARNELDIITSPLFSFDNLEEYTTKQSHQDVETLNLEIEGDATQSTGDTELNRQGCPASQVDGTKCQFSACGRDYGLVSCAIGYAKGVVGGLHGLRYVVANDDDNALNPTPGSFRYATNLARGTSSGVWITFARSMIIVLQDMLWVQSHTTIDGRGVNVTINGRNLVLGGVQNVIIHNIQINNIRGSDTLHIFSGTTKVWVDHLTSFAGELGLASVLQGSTDVTISNSKLQNYNFNMLLGASDADSEDRSLRVTVYRNWFRDSMQRMPHCRWGVCHVVNNLYTNWGYYAIGGRANARVRSEGNVFVPGRAREVTPWFEGAPATFDMSARIESKNDLLLDGATFHQFLVATSDVTPSYSVGSSPPIISTSSLPSLVEQCSGALFGGNLLRCQQV